MVPIQPQSPGPLLASLNGIEWGGHLVREAASANFKVNVRIALLSLLLSPNFSSLEHLPGAYSTAASPLFCFHARADLLVDSEIEAFAPSGLEDVPNIRYIDFYVSTEKLFYVNAEPGQRTYLIKACAMICDVNDVPIEEVDDGGKARPTKTSVLLKWTVDHAHGGDRPIRDERGPSIDWGCIAGLLRTFALCQDVAVDGAGWRSNIE